MANARGSIGTTNYAVEITAGHHQLTADEGPALGGKDAGPSPYDLLCASLTACTAITLRMYAERKGWPLTSVEVNVHFTAANKEKGTAATIERTLRFEGGLEAEQVARLADIAERTPVTLTLKAGVPIATSVKS
ncbi:MAG TPA: OsmC family protein [Kofleriaceae bacterium]|nr:OsmC family protein [Kofleriaceae bacterium]